MIKELSDEELLYASDEDWAFYKEIAAQLPSMAGKNNDGLDKFGVPIPYHSGPHILRHFRETIEIVKPKKIIEFGFNMGHSAAMWLELSDAYLHSFDISEKDETTEAARFLEKKYFPRFTFWRADTKMLILTDPDIDLIFIDGAHDEASITKDIRIALYGKVKYLLFDDWYPRYAETQKAVAKFPELELVKDMNNLRLYKFKD